MKRQSPKQAKRERTLRERKLARITREIDERGFVSCEGECGRMYGDPERAMRELAGHHRKHRGMGASYNRQGIDDEQNIRLLCDVCHRREHA